MNIQQIKAEEQKRTNELLTSCGVFWAFSNEQFQENKTPLKEGEKYVSIGAGGYIPKGNVEALTNGVKDIKKWFSQATKDAKTRRAHIAYELANHEAYYTGDIEATLSALGEGYTAEEVWSVYHAESKRHRANA